MNSYKLIFGPNKKYSTSNEELPRFAYHFVARPMLLNDEICVCLLNTSGVSLQKEAVAMPPSAIAFQTSNVK
jgi:hypothetical protein